MATLVVGPTCVGKSTFISHRVCAPDAAVVLGWEVPTLGIPPATEFVHYNLLHPFQMPVTTGGIREALEQDPYYSAIMSSSAIDEAVVLVAPIKILKARMATRQTVEPLLLEGRDGPYPADVWQEILEQSDLFRIYLELFESLRHHGIPFSCWASGADTGSQPEFASIDELFVHTCLNGRSVTAPSREEVHAAISLPGAHYQVVELPGGLSSDAGGYSHVQHGRRMTFDAIFRDVSLRGRSVLDVGCASGDFLFRCEQRGASRLVGLEPEHTRWEAAVAFAGLRHSTAEIHFASLDDYRSSRRAEEASGPGFDWVLALNVIHHVSDPHVFVDGLVEFSRGHVVIEFPTLSDPIWRESVGLADDFGHGSVTQLPIVGLGVKGYHQRFVFTERAVKELVAATDPRFKASMSLASPIPARRILVFCAVEGCEECGKGPGATTEEQLRPADAHPAKPDRPGRLWNRLGQRLRGGIGGSI